MRGDPVAVAMLEAGSCRRESTPPSRNRVLPEKNRALPDSKKQAVSAISSGVAMRSSAWHCFNWANASSFPTKPAVSIGVATAAGARQTTRISGPRRSEEHTSELQSLMRISYAVFCLKKKYNKKTYKDTKN